MDKAKQAVSGAQRLAGRKLEPAEGMGAEESGAASGEREGAACLGCLLIEYEPKRLPSGRIVCVRCPDANNA